MAQIFFASQGSSTPPPPDVPPSATPAERAEIERVARETHAQLPDPKTMNTMGAMQWAIILQFAVYFCTYAIDLYVCQAADTELEKEAN